MATVSPTRGGSVTSARSTISFRKPLPMRTAMADPHGPDSPVRSLCLHLWRRYPRLVAAPLLRHGQQYPFASRCRCGRRWQTLTGLILLSDRSASIYGDGIPDSWRLRYFGTVNNILSQAAADADGDGRPSRA